MRTGAILAREFQRLAAERNDPSLLLLSRQADVLQVSVSHLSRVRRGKVSLTPELAATIAACVWPNHSDARSQLMHELLQEEEQRRTAAELNVGSIKTQVKEFFAGLHAQDALLCIEYRDFPRASDTGAYPELAKGAADAVRAGLTMALFQPFGDPSRGGADEGPPPDPAIANYLRELRHQVQRVYERMFRFAFESDPTVASRFVLYEHRHPVASGIQSRLFYVENRSKSPVEYTAWDWVAGEQDDAFVQRDPRSISVQAIAAQFEPIVGYWREHPRKLPYKKDEMNDATKGYRARRVDLSADEARALESPWEVYERR